MTTATRRCSRCIMDDSSDNTIVFDEDGCCDYCTDALKAMGDVYFPNEIGREKLAALLRDVKNHGRDHKYDCIMGVSGGLDSSYLAYLGKQWGLKVLAVHIDDGFDSAISKRNLERLISATGFDYLVVTPDAEQFGELTKAYLRAGVPNAAVPQDNVLIAFLYDCIARYKIRYFFSGSNFALENILQRGGTYDNTDLVNLRDVHKQYGSAPLDRLKLISSARILLLRMLNRVRVVQPLDFIDYDRDRAMSELESFCGFEYYGAKHLENRLTEFVQLYWLYHRFGIDKRTSHISSRVVSGQLTREAGLAEYAMPIYEEQHMSECISFVKSKLRISDEEFDSYMSGEVRQHSDFRTARSGRALASARRFRTRLLRTLRGFSGPRF